MGKVIRRWRVGSLEEEKFGIPRLRKLHMQHSHHFPK
jgi:hypothetical protein